MGGLADCGFGLIPLHGQAALRTLVFLHLSCAELMHKSDVAQNANTVHAADIDYGRMIEGSISGAKNIGLARDRSLQNRIVIRISNNPKEAAGTSTISPTAALLRHRNVHLGITAGCGGVHGFRYALDMLPKRRPLRMADHHDSDRAPLQVLLIPEILVGGKEEIESVFLGGDQQLAVSQSIPPEINSNGYLMRGQVSFYRDRRPLIEEYAHLLRSVCRGLVKTARREFDYSFHLGSIQTGEPFHDVVNVRTGFQIFKDGGNRHSGVFQNPCAANLAWHAFNNGTLRPVNCPGCVSA